MICRHRMWASVVPRRNSRLHDASFQLQGRDTKFSKKWWHGANGRGHTTRPAIVVPNVVYILVHIAGMSSAGIPIWCSINSAHHTRKSWRRREGKGLSKEIRFKVIFITSVQSIKGWARQCLLRSSKLNVPYKTCVPGLQLVEAWTTDNAAQVPGKIIVLKDISKHWTSRYCSKNLKELKACELKGSYFRFVHEPSAALLQPDIVYHPSPAWSLLSDDLRAWRCHWEYHIHLALLQFHLKVQSFATDVVWSNTLQNKAFVPCESECTEQMQIVVPA